MMQVDDSESAGSKQIGQTAGAVSACGKAKVPAWGMATLPEPGLVPRAPGARQGPKRAYWKSLLIRATTGDVAGWCSLAVIVPAVWFGRDSLSMLNFILLQWLGLRLARLEVRGVMRARARRPVRAGQLVTEHDVDMATAEPARRWTLQRWIWPLTGWWSPLRWIARRP